MRGSRESSFKLHIAGPGVDWARLSGRTLTANIRQRRGSLVDIRVPLFIDKNTVIPEGSNNEVSNGHAGELLWRSGAK